MNGASGKSKRVNPDDVGDALILIIAAAVLVVLVVWRFNGGGL